MIEKEKKLKPDLNDCSLVSNANIIRIKIGVY